MRTAQETTLTLADKDVALIVRALTTAKNLEENKARTIGRDLPWREMFLVHARAFSRVKKEVQAQRRAAKGTRR